MKAVSAWELLPRFDFLHCWPVLRSLESTGISLITGTGFISRGARRRRSAAYVFVQIGSRKAAN